MASMFSYINFVSRLLNLELFIQNCIVIGENNELVRLVV